MVFHEVFQSFIAKSQVSVTFRGAVERIFESGMGRPPHDTGPGWFKFLGF